MKAFLTAAGLLLLSLTFSAHAQVKPFPDPSSACESMPANTVCANATNSPAAPGAVAMGSQLLINVKTLGAKEDGVTDDSAALAAAVTQVNAFAALTVPVYACVYIPAGVLYDNGGTAAVAFTTGTPGCIIGDGGEAKSVIKLGSGFSGDLFAWSEAWTQFGGLNIALITPTGPTVRGIEILGYKDNAVWPASTVIQNAFNFYDEDEWININDVTTVFLSGYTLRCGVLKNDAAAFCRESNITDLRIFKGGNTATPVPNVLIYTDCNAGCVTSGIDSSNQMNFVNFRDYAPQGTAVKIANNRATAPIRKIRFANSSVEGDPADQSGGARAGNLFQIGDASLLGTETEVLVVNPTFVSPYTGYYELGITGTASLVPFGIDFLNAVFEAGAGGGGGVTILSGKQIRIQSDVWSTGATDLNVGPASGGVGSPITIDLGARESALNSSINATSTGFVQTPVYKTTLSTIAPHSVTVLCQSNAAANTGSTTTEVNLFACAVPANAMGTNAALRVTVFWSSTATAVAKQAIVRYSVNAGITGTAYHSQALTTSDALAQSQTIIRENNAASSQVGYPIGFTPYAAGTATAVVTSTVTTTNASTVNVNCTDGSSNGTTELCGINGVTVELITP